MEQKLGIILATGLIGRAMKQHAVTKWNCPLLEVRGEKCTTWSKVQRTKTDMLSTWPIIEKIKQKFGSMGRLFLVKVQFQIEMFQREIIGKFSEEQN